MTIPHLGNSWKVVTITTKMRRTVRTNQCVIVIIPHFKHSSLITVLLLCVQSFQDLSNRVSLQLPQVTIKHFHILSFLSLWLVCIKKLLNTWIISVAQTVDLFQTDGVFCDTWCYFQGFLILIFSSFWSHEPNVCSLLTKGSQVVLISGLLRELSDNNEKRCFFFNHFNYNN